jgi:flagellar biosynthesis/type III secretory pathway protein FliH
MEYGSYSDEELRRVLNADDRDVDAIVEAAARFAKASHETDADELEDARKEGYDEGYHDAREEYQEEWERPV